MLSIQEQSVTDIFNNSKTPSGILFKELNCETSIRLDLVVLWCYGG